MGVRKDLVAEIEYDTQCKLWREQARSRESVMLHCHVLPMDITNTGSSVGFLHFAAPP